MSKVRCVWRVKYPTLFCYKLLDLCLVHLRKCLFQLWFPPTKLLLRSHTCMSFITDPRMVKNHPSAQMNKLVSIVSSTSMWMAPLLRQVQMRPLGFWNGFTTSESSRWDFPGAKGIEADICILGWSPFDQLLAIYAGFYKAGYHSMSSGNPLAGLMNCSAQNKASLVMGVFMEVANDQLRYMMTFW